MKYFSGFDGRDVWAAKEESIVRSPAVLAFALCDAPPALIMLAMVYATGGLVALGFAVAAAAYVGAMMWVHMNGRYQDALERLSDTEGRRIALNRLVAEHHEIGALGRLARWRDGYCPVCMRYAHPLVREECGLPAIERALAKNAGAVAKLDADVNAQAREMIAAMTPEQKAAVRRRLGLEGDT